NGVVLDTGKLNLKTAHTRKNLLDLINRENPEVSLKEALRGADVFIGLSKGRILDARDLYKMRQGRIVFAMANPEPEVEPTRALRACRIFATGRSDLPNQINNALAFPGVFRGALDARARVINDPMKLAAAEAIAKLITPQQLSPEYIVPSIFDKRVVENVARAVKDAARDTRVSRTHKLQ
ncbi:MAG: hypothetical protein MN733_41965, partial [Nitrososphaera sp.]|nr:hypothetical protein [Nitrososphaera sp.]